MLSSAIIPVSGTAAWEVHVAVTSKLMIGGVAASPSRSR